MSEPDADVPSRKARTAFQEVFLLYLPPGGAAALRAVGRAMEASVDGTGGSP